MNGKSCPKAAPQITDANQDHQENTSPVLHISDSLKVLLLSQFTTDQLRHMANLKAQDAPGLRARRQLDNAGIDDLVDLIVGRNGIPTVGFWRRRTAA
jgi:hypothetical protein